MDVIYKGKKFFYSKRKVLDRIQLYTRLGKDEVEVLDKFIKYKYPHNKAMWIRRAILKVLKEDLKNEAS